jgi:hypothetical protein
VNNVDFETSNICQNLCVAYNVTYFILKICTVVEYIIGYIQICFQIFFETLNIEFGFCKKKRLHFVSLDLNFLMMSTLHVLQCTYILALILASCRGG